ncbi:uncharacterized protein LOC131224913 [Magnolia sinica]|uniref:uncharacterized protein LOC131224913 n=1 Tax=Magnolia sinica TaxID=86752 RepID=UPI0026591982|nr:uncharacterized protein LOC131224913 [Magnolia sinica]
MEESIPLDLTIISASKMDVYAVASLSSNHRRKHKTHIHMCGSRNPNWNYPTTIDVPITNNHGIILSFKLFSSCFFHPDRLIGEVLVPIKDLLDTFHYGRDPSVVEFVSYQVRKPSGKPQGILNFSYKFRGEVAKVNCSITARYNTTTLSFLPLLGVIAPSLRGTTSQSFQPLLRVIAPLLRGTITPSAPMIEAHESVTPQSMGVNTTSLSAPPALGIIASPSRGTTIPRAKELRVAPPPMRPCPSAPMYPGPMIGYVASPD